MVFRRILAKGLLALAALALGGCGWSARDEYLSRQRSIAATDGDGSELVMHHPDPFAAQRGQPLAEGR